MKVQNAYRSPVTYAEPITIECEVYGKKMVAEILGEEDNPIHYCYQVRFSNGAEFTVFSSEYKGWLPRDHVYNRYVDAIRDELQCFHCVAHYEFHKFDFNIKGSRLVVWLSENNNEEYGEHFDVYYSGDYQWTLKKVKGQWSSLCKRVMTPGYSNDAIALLVTQQLDLIK